MPNKYVFVSFSSRDSIFVKDILSSLASQHIDFWDYTNEMQEVEVGDAIMERVKREIDKCDYFIALISPNSNDPAAGKYVQFELEYAFKLNFIEKEKIISIALKNENDSRVELRGFFEKIKHIKYEEIVFNYWPLYVKTIRGICKRLDQDYIPPIEAHSRLPFRDLFRKEILQIAHSNSEHVELMAILGEFNEYFKRGNWEQAHFLISHFISSCKYKIPGYKLFYPWIVKAVCEQQLNMIDEAGLSYRKAGETRPTDENVFGGLGSIYHIKGDFEKAESYFSKSLEYCSPDNNRDEKINYINALLENGKEIPADFKKFILNLDLSEFSEDELIRIKNIQVSLLYRNNETNAALKILEDMYFNHLYDTSTIIFYHQCLLQNGNSEKAGIILIKASNENNSKLDIMIINHYLSDFYLSIGEINKAISIYDNYLLKAENHTRQFYIKYARIFEHLRNYSKVKQVCSDLISGKIFPLPKSREDFYYDGFAQYILGNKERAKYDYERSENFDLYYAEHYN